MIKNKVRVLIYICILLTIIFLNNQGYTNQNKELKYTPFLNIGEDYSYGSVFVGDPLSENHKVLLEECRNFIKNYAVEMFEFEKEQYLRVQKEGKIKNLKNFEPKEVGDDNIGKYYFCWPSDAVSEEQNFFRENGYINPSTKDKIFPLGERKYSDEPKPKIELIEEHKK